MLVRNTTRVLIVIILTFFLLNVHQAFAETGIIEIYSEPNGAKVYIDNIYVGKTPYQNIEIPTGSHKIKVELSKEYPAQFWEVNVDSITPQTKTFIFRSNTGGSFTGTETQQTIEKYTGNIQFASIPTGAMVFVNGEQKKKTPLGYTGVAVGRYDVEFKYNGKSIKGKFSISKDETVKLIGDFNQMKVINKSEEDKGIYPEYSYCFKAVEIHREQGHSDVSEASTRKWMESYDLIGKPEKEHEKHHALAICASYLLGAKRWETPINKGEILSLYKEMTDNFNKAIVKGKNSNINNKRLANYYFHKAQFLSDHTVAKHLKEKGILLPIDCNDIELSYQQSTKLNPHRVAPYRYNAFFSACTKSVKQRQEIFNKAYKLFLDNPLQIEDDYGMLGIDFCSLGDKEKASQIVKFACENADTEKNRDYYCNRLGGAKYCNK